MNECLFFLHAFLVLGFVFIALRLGKNALLALAALQAVLANLFIVKQISLFGSTVTCSDVFVIGELLSLNFLQEFFGKQEASKGAKVSLLALVFFLAMSWMHLAYLPSEYDQSDAAFRQIFAQSPRIIFASLTTFALVQQFDLRFFAALRGIFLFRITGALLVSQVLDTVLFSFLGLYGLVEDLGAVICLSLAVKISLIFLSAPLTLIAKKWARNAVSL